MECLPPYYKCKNHSFEDVGMYHAKNRGNKDLSNTIKDTSTIMRNPLPELCRDGLRMIVLVSLIVLLRGFPCFQDLSHGPSLHPY